LDAFLFINTTTRIRMGGLCQAVLTKADPAQQNLNVWPKDFYDSQDWFVEDFLSGRLDEPP
jgi:hypothetical protein